MLHRHAVVAVFSLVLIGFASNGQAQLYKWVDADGKTQYTDTPPPANAKSSTALRTSPASPAPATNSTADQEKAFQKRREDANKAETKAGDDAKAASAKSQRCQEARSYLATLNDGGRIMRTNSKGEREYLNDADIDSEKKRAQAAITESCQS